MLECLVGIHESAIQCVEEGFAEETQQSSLVFSIKAGFRLLGFVMNKVFNSV